MTIQGMLSQPAGTFTVSESPPCVPVRSHWPRHEADEIAAVTDVLQSGQVNALLHGTHTRALADGFARWTGMAGGHCVANGTVSLEVGLRALGIGPGDEVIVPARSFFATASCVLAVGATPVFADIDPVTQNMDPASAARLVGTRTAALICVHLAGWPCDMDALVALCDAHDIALVEDCAQAHGATWRGRPVGGFGAVSSFSFCTDKIMSTGGEGGLVLTRDEATSSRAWSIKDHGKSRELLNDGKGTPGTFRYVHTLPGSNYRMTEMQAAIGRCQFAKLPGWLERRRRNAAILLDAWSDLPEILLPRPPAHAGHAWYKFYVRLAPENPAESNESLAARRQGLIAALMARGIPAGSGSCPDMSLEHALAAVPIRRDAALQAAHRLGAATLMFPCDHTLEEEDMARIASALREALGR